MKLPATVRPPYLRFPREPFIMSKIVRTFAVTFWCCSPQMPRGER